MQFLPTGFINGHTLKIYIFKIDYKVKRRKKLPQKAHKHLVVAGTIKTRLICDNLVSLIVVSVLIIAA